MRRVLAKLKGEESREEVEARRLPGLVLKFACPRYDRIEPLTSGVVQPDGISLNCEVVKPAEAHRRMLEGEFDVSEMSMSYYMMLKLAGKPSITAIPVFPMRSFFHTQLLVNVDSGIEKPTDLRGKRIGVQEYGMTLALWLRGILRDEFNIQPAEMDWFVERGEGKKVSDALGFEFPSDIKVHQVPPETDLMAMLAEGELDVAFPYPKHWRTGSDRTTDLAVDQSRKVRRLFPDRKAEAIRYYRKTGFFPINHTIAIKNAVLERNPWVARSLLDAFVRAKEISFQRSWMLSLESTNFVWLDSLLEEVTSVFGDDPFPYGLKANRQILNKMAEYSHDQGLTPSRAKPEELFVSTTLDS